MNNKTIMAYEGQQITFQNADGTTMVNATQMAKTFGKKPVEWLRLQTAQEYIEELSTVVQICTTDLVKVKQGGTDQGTWMHEDVALEFARWLSPKFAIWTNKQIKELMRTGSVQIAEPRTDKSEAQQMHLKLAFTEQAARILNLSDVTKLRMLKQVASEFGCADLLPAYTEAPQDVYKSATELLQEHGLAIKTREFNDIMVDAGYLENQTRKKKNGKLETFRVVTQKGKAYGDNFMDSHSSGATQAKWKVSTFRELCLSVYLPIE